MNWIRAGRIAGAITVATAVVGAELRAAEPARIEVPELVKQLNRAFVQVAEQVSRSVVVIRVAHRPTMLPSGEREEGSFWDLLPREFREYLEDQQGNPNQDPIFDGQGSGVVIRKEGFVLTNRHVVEGADQIRVRFADGREYPARVQGVDVQSDIAVLKIESEDEFEPALLGDSSKTRVGEFAIAIGAPFDLDYSVTFGHVSAKGRSQIIPDPTLDQDFIQTDANINPGNSGGPLVNIYGEVIGINTLIRGLRTGIGFAIPINLAKEVAEQLIEKGSFTRAWLGVGIRALRDDPDLRALVDVTDGVVVTEVMEGGPAARSELRPTDIVLEVDGHRVATAQQLKNEVRSKRIGKEITLKVHRAGQVLDITVVPEAWPQELAVLPRLERAEPERATQDTLGLTVQTLTAELAKELGLENRAGVVVTEVELDSPAERKSIAVGDVITEVNRERVRNVEQFMEALGRSDLRKGVIINYNHNGTSRYTVLKRTR